MHIIIYVSWWTYIAFVLGIYLGMVLRDSLIAKQFSKMVVPVYTATINVWELWLLHISTNT